MAFRAPLLAVLSLLLPAPLRAQQATVPVSRPAGATLAYRSNFLLRDPSIASLSGVTYGGQTRYYAIADNSDRVYPLAIDLKPDGAIASVEVLRPLRMPRRGNYEGIAFAPARDSVFVADESPAIGEHRLPGMAEIRRLPVPGVFARHTVANQGFESLSLSPDGKTLWTANERALAIDGNPKLDATPILVPTRVRLLRYDVRGDGSVMPTAQYEYITSGVHDWGGQVGLCDLAALPDGRLLALERSGAMNFRKVGSIRSRIYLIDSAGATDISGETFASGLNDPDRTDPVTPHPATTQPAAPGTAAPRQPTTGSVAATSITPVGKVLLYDGFVCEPRGQNLEGLCLGPQLAPGRWVVVGGVDSTDGPLGISKSRIVTFELNLAAREAAPTSRHAR